jgi:hypothetical protein
MTQYTPGPYKVVYNPGATTAEVVTDNANVRPGKVATVYGCTAANVAANAKLLALSSEMRDLLAALVNYPFVSGLPCPRHAQAFRLLDELRDAGVRGGR